MHLSQSSVSQAISSIEKQLKIQLFIRDRKNVKLTSAGQDLYLSLKPWLNDYYKAVQHAQNIDSKNQTNLTLGYSGTPYEYAILPLLIRNFCKEFPDVKIFLENYDHSLLMEHLKNGNCDIIFTMPDIINRIDGLDYFNLLNGHYCLVVPQNNELAKKSIISISELNEQSIVFLDHRWCPPSQNKLQQQIIQNNKHLNLSYVNNIATAHSMVKAHAGLGIWANFVQDPNDNDLKCLKLETDIIPKYGVATLKNSRDLTAKRFIKWLYNSDLMC